MSGMLFFENDRDYLTNAVVGAVLLRINSLRNSGKIEQAVAECEAFNSRLKFFYDHAFPVGNINSAFEASSMAINMAIAPSSFYAGALAGPALWANSAERGAFSFSFNGSPIVKVNNFRDLALYINFTTTLAQLSQTVGVPMIAIANLIYSRLYPSETNSSDTNYTQEFFSQLSTTVGTAAMPIVGESIRSAIHQVYYETSELLNVLKAEKDGVNFIEESLLKWFSDQDSMYKGQRLYKSLKKYGNENTAAVLLYLAVIEKASLFGLDSPWDDVEKLLDSVERIDLGSKKLQTSGVSLVSLFVRQKQWKLLKKLLKKIPTIDIDSDRVTPVLSAFKVGNGVLTPYETMQQAALIDAILARIKTKYKGPKITIDSKVLEQLLIREITRRKLELIEYNQNSFTTSTWQTIEDMRAEATILDAYFNNVPEVRAQIIKAFENKDDPLHAKCMEQMQAFRLKSNLDQAKLIFLKILKNAGIPNPKDTQEQQEYKKIFKEKFKVKFYELVENNGQHYIKDNEEVIYAAARNLKSPDLKIDGIDFAAIMPKIEKRKLRS